MNGKIWKGAAFVAMLLALVMCLSSCSFIDKFAQGVDWSSVFEQVMLQMANTNDDDAPEEIIVVKEVNTEKDTCDYERYQNMSAEEQEKLIDSFESMEAFFAWLNDAQEAHAAHSDAIEIGSNTVIDMSGLAD